MVSIFVLMVGESVFRFLGSYITGANELIGWCCAAAGFLALPATFKRGDMVRAGFVVDRLPHALAQDRAAAVPGGGPGLRQLHGLGRRPLPVGRLAQPKRPRRA